MRVWKVVALIGAALTLAVAAGCGGTASVSGVAGDAALASAQTGGADVLPATTAAFVELSTQFDSEQWRQVEALGSKLPGYDSLLKQARDELAKRGLDFDRDVRPALGPEVDLGWLDLASRDRYVAVTKPDDPQKLDALVAKASPPPVRLDVNGYAVLAPTQALADSVSSAGSKLADDSSFQAAMAALPAGGVVRAYVSGAQAQAALRTSLATGASGLPGVTLPSGASVGNLEWAAASASATAAGVRVDGVVKTDPAPATKTFHAELPSRFAAGAIAYVGFAGVDGSLENALDQLEKTAPTLRTRISQLEAVSGLSLQDDVLPLLANEGGVAIYPSGGDQPTVALALKVDDQAKAEKVLGQLGALAALGGGTGGAPVAISVPGYTDARKLTLGSTSIVYGFTNGLLVLSTAEAGLGKVGADGPKLADDARFKAAEDGANMPDRTAGFLYADLAAALPLAIGQAQAGGTTVPPAVKESASALKSVLLYATVDGDLLRVAGFAGVG